MVKKAWRVGLAAAVVSVGACNSGGGGGDPKLATHAAAANAGEAISRTGQALSFALTSDGTLSKAVSAGNSTSNVVLDSMTTTSGSTSPSELAAQMAPKLPTSMMRALVGPTLAAEVTATPMPSMMTTQEKFDQAASEIRRLMDERLFVDSNLESDDGSTATYLLKADPTCRPLPEDTDPPGTVPPIGANCETNLAKVDVRIAVTNDGDGVRMRVLIAAERLELVAFVIHSDLLAVELDLPKAKAAVDLINTKLGTDDSPTGTYDRLTGKYQLALKLVNAQTVTASMSILEAFDIAETGGAEVIIAKSNPLIAVTGDGLSKKAKVQVGLGATEVATTWDPRKTGVANRDVRVTTGGVYGTLDLDESSKTITLTDVGVGGTKMLVRGTTIFDLNLNPNQMRRFSGDITVNADDTAHLMIQPAFDLTLGFDFNAVAADFSSPPAATIAHDTYGVSLVNGGAACVLDTVKSNGAFAGGLRVGAGTLTLTAASAPSETVTVPAGQCLTSVAGGAPAGKNPLLGALTAAACP